MTDFSANTTWLQQHGGSCQTTAPVAVAMCWLSIRGVNLMLSQAYTWCRATMRDQASGMPSLSAPTPYNVHRSMTEDGICLQALWSSFSGTPDAAANANAATHKVTIEEPAGDYVAAGIAALNARCPFVGNGFYTDAWVGYSAASYAAGVVIPAATSTSQFIGGHDWQVVGHNPAKRAFLCCNGWPAYGFFWLAEDYFAPIAGMSQSWNGLWIIRDVGMGAAVPSTPLSTAQNACRVVGDYLNIP